jgi:IDEAL domain.
MIAYHDDDHDGIWQALTDDINRRDREKVQHYKALIYACIDVALDTGDRQWFSALVNLQKTIG